jgi:thioredoxin-related protein
MLHRLQEFCVLQPSFAVLLYARMNLIRAGLIIAIFLASWSCGVFGKKAEQDEEKNPFGPSGVPSFLRTNPEVDGPLGEAPLPGTPAAEVTVALANHPRQDNIVWTDPDDMDKDLPELRKLLSGPKTTIWLKSESEAKRRAIREGKCVMIWFTDSARSPLCKTISEEVLGKKEFGDWASENVVRLVVDQSAMQARGEKFDNEVTEQQYVADMKKKYKALGNPTVIMLSPMGERLAKYTGFKKGQGEFFWGQLKHSSSVGKEEYAVWMKKLEKQGFRRWTDRDDRTLVARLISYNKGSMVMVEPDGNRFRTKESQLCDADQTWILEEKKKRGIQ